MRRRRLHETVPPATQRSGRMLKWWLYAPIALTCSPHARHRQITTEEEWDDILCKVLGGLSLG